MEYHTGREMFTIIEDILGCEYIWYTRNRNYDVFIGMKIVAYNFIILLNQSYQRPKRHIMDALVLRKMRHSNYTISR